MKNLNLLKRFISSCLISEGVIKLPEFDENDFLKKVKIAYDAISSTISEFVEEVGGIENVEIYKYLDVSSIEIKDFDGENIKIRIAIYKCKPNDEICHSNADALWDKRRQTIAYNIDTFAKEMPNGSLKMMPFDTFKETLYHELVHAKDPYHTKKDRSPPAASKDYIKYATDQGEYTAQMSAYVHSFESFIKNDTSRALVILDLVLKVLKFEDMYEFGENLNDFKKNFLDLFMNSKSTNQESLDEDLEEEIEQMYWTWISRFFNWAKSWVSDLKTKKKFLKDFYRAFEPFLA